MPGPEGKLGGSHRRRTPAVRHRADAPDQTDREAGGGVKRRKQEADRARPLAAHVAGSRLGFL